jgi:predicted nucleotidyltransferase
MVEMDAIRELANRIVQEFSPEQIILFGSYAYGTPTEDSDVDLLIIMQSDGDVVRKSVEILERVRPQFAVDLLVRTPQQVAARMSLDDYFMRDIVEHGRVLYEAAHV